MADNGDPAMSVSTSDIFVPGSADWSRGNLWLAGNSVHASKPGAFGSTGKVRYIIIEVATCGWLN